MIENTTTNQSTSTSSQSTTVPNPPAPVEVITNPIENTVEEPQVDPTPIPVIPDINIDWRDQDLWDFRIELVDPIAQSFIVDHPNGAWFSSVDLFFKAKDPNIPVNVSIRQMFNGYPTQLVIPGANVNVYPADINVSTDGSVATNVKFDYPVYIPAGREASICLISMSDKPELFVSTVGEFDLTNPSSRITKQPHNGVFFKSANASTWTPEQSRDLKFTLNRCVFSTTPQTVDFINEVNPTQRLKVNPFLFASNPTGTTVNVRVFQKDHGLHSSGDQVTISGATGTINGVPSANLNGTHTVSEVELDSYMITVTGQATRVGARSGGTGVRATKQYQYSLANIIVNEMKLPATEISYTLSTVSGKSVDNTDETAYNTSTLFSDVPITPNRDLKFTSMRSIPNALNSNNQGATLQCTLTNNGNNFVSPAIDLDRLSMIAVNNRINNPDSSYDDAASGRIYNTETTGVGGDALSSYVTKRVVLNEEAEVIKAFLSVNRPSGSDIELWYKVAAVGSNADFKQLDWNQATPALAAPIDNSGRYTEIEFDIAPLANGEAFKFGSFAFKIVFRSTSARKVPTCKDFRAIAAI